MKTIMNERVIEMYLTEMFESFDGYKKLAERAIEQISDEEFFAPIDAESNSIAAIVKHVGGNLRSRWTDFLTTDGEKTDRNRDAEFVAESDTRDSLMRIWDNGWQAFFDTLKSLRADDLGKIVQIRGEDFTVIRALNRSFAHTAYHVGQIVFLAKHLRAADWKTLSIPKNKSAEFTDWMKSEDDQGNYLEAVERFGGENLK